MENLCWRDMCQHLKEIQVACGPTESGLPKKQNRITAVRVREAKRASWSRAKPRPLHHSPFEINRCFSKDLLSLSNVLFQISQNGFWQKHQEIGALRWWTRSWIWEPRMVSRYDNVTTKIYIRCPVHWCLNRITHADWWQNLKYKSCMCMPVFFLICPVWSHTWKYAFCQCPVYPLVFIQPLNWEWVMWFSYDGEGKMMNFQIGWGPLLNFAGKEKKKQRKHLLD